MFFANYRAQNDMTLMDIGTNVTRRFLKSLKIFWKFTFLFIF